jgi:hypothetical protein
MGIEKAILGFMTITMVYLSLHVMWWIAGAL